jgi:hypothetical protein
MKALLKFLLRALPVVWALVLVALVGRSMGQHEANGTSVANAPTASPVLTAGGPETGVSKSAPTTVLPPSATIAPTATQLPTKPPTATPTNTAMPLSQQDQLNTTVADANVKATVNSRLTQVSASETALKVATNLAVTQAVAVQLTLTSISLLTPPTAIPTTPINLVPTAGNPLPSFTPPPDQGTLSCDVTLNIGDGSSTVDIYDSPSAGSKLATPQLKKQNGKNPHAQLATVITDYYRDMIIVKDDKNAPLTVWTDRDNIQPQKDCGGVPQKTLEMVYREKYVDLYAKVFGTRSVGEPSRLFYNTFPDNTPPNWTMQSVQPAKGGETQPTLKTSPADKKPELAFSTPLNVGTTCDDLPFFVQPPPVGDHPPVVYNALLAFNFLTWRYCVNGYIGIRLTSPVPDTADSDYLEIRLVGLANNGNCTAELWLSQGGKALRIQVMDKAISTLDCGNNEGSYAQLTPQSVLKEGYLEIEVFNGKLTVLIDGVTAFKDVPLTKFNAPDGTASHAYGVKIVTNQSQTALRFAIGMGQTQP